MFKDQHVLLFKPLQPRYICDKNALGKLMQGNNCKSPIFSTAVSVEVQAFMDQVSQIPPQNYNTIMINEMCSDWLPQCNAIRE